MRKQIVSAIFFISVTSTLTGCSLFPSVDTSAPILNIVSQTRTSLNPTPEDEDQPASLSTKIVDFQTKIASDSAFTAATESGLTTTVTPTGEPSPLPKATPAENQAQLEIKSSNIRLSGDNKKLVIEGELLNKGNVAADLTGFKIIATIYDKKGRVLTSGAGETVLKSLDPETTTPFQITLDRVAGADSYRLQGGF